MPLGIAILGNLSVDQIIFSILPRFILNINAQNQRFWKLQEASNSYKRTLSWYNHESSFDIKLLVLLSCALVWHCQHVLSELLHCIWKYNIIFECLSIVVTQKYGFLWNLHKHVMLLFEYKLPRSSNCLKFIELCCFYMKSDIIDK